MAACIFHPQPRHCPDSGPGTSYEFCGMLDLKTNGKVSLIRNAFLIYGWLTVLAPLSVTDTYYSVYIFCALLGFLCLCDNYRCSLIAPVHIRVWIALFAFFFPLAVLLANYTLFEPLRILQKLFEAMLVFGGGFSIGYQILICMFRRLPITLMTPNGSHPVKLFCAAFFSIIVIDFVYLFFVRYPGILTTDSFSTISQIVGTSGFDNTMPFWHTVTVMPFYRFGVFLFGDANGGAALFHCAQIVFMAACFSYALVTMYQKGIPSPVLVLTYALYALMPYNIVYSITLWKDIPFAGAVLLFVTALYRLLSQIGGNKKANHVLLVCGALDICLWRTNGLPAFAVTVIVLFLFLRKQYKRILSLLFAVLAFTWVLLNPVLDLLGVSPTNLVEGFAVPMQQVARLVANNRPLTTEQETLLSDIFWIDKMAELYDPQTVDPIKFETFRYDQVDVIKKNPSKYIKLYFSLGMRYPGDYIKAWIEETKGYWNGGYFFWTYTLKMGENDYGIAHTGGESFVAELYAALFRYVEKLTILQPLMSIGLHVWALTACCVINALKRRREGLLCIPLLVLILGLILGTPVYSEFRYAYPVMITFPLILFATVFEGRK